MNLVYKHENALKYLAIAISLPLWAALVVATKGLALIWVVPAVIIYLFAQSAFISHIKGTGVKVSAEQYPDVYRHLQQGCQKLGLDAVPDGYVLRTNTFNALATRFLGRSFVVLYAEVLDALQDHPDSIAFYVGHELGHLKRRHLQWHLVLLPASVLPLLGAGYRRAQEYTCDRHGLACSPNLAVAQMGLLAIGTSGSRLGSTSVASYMAQVEATRSFWMSFHELIGDYPWLTKRVAEITSAAGGSATTPPRRNPFAWILAAFIPRFGSVAGGASPLIAIAILGVLAAIAIPAYQDYVIRSQVTEGLNLASSYKAAVAAAAAASEDGFEGIDNNSLELPMQVDARYVESIEVSLGAVVITYGASAAPALKGQVLTQVPGIGADGGIVWACGRSAPPAGVEFSVADYAQYTSVPDKYLPQSCRDLG